MISMLGDNRCWSARGRKANKAPSLEGSGQERWGTVREINIYCPGDQTCLVCTTSISSWNLARTQSRCKVGQRKRIQGHDGMKSRAVKHPAWKS